MSRLATRKNQIFIDLLVLSFALSISFLLRFDWVLPWLMFKRLVINLPYIVGLQYLVLMFSGITRYAWRYIGLREVNRMFGAMGLASLILLTLRFISGWVYELWYPAVHVLIPLGVIMINFVLAFMGIAGVRVIRRLLAEREKSQSLRPLRREPVTTLLIGAGQAGILVAREIGGRPDLAIRPIGFVDDDPEKQGMVIHGIPVLGTSVEIAALCEEYEVKQAIITISNAPGQVVRKLAKSCEDAAVITKIIPGMHQLIGGKLNLARIREVSVEDLLRREAVSLETDSLHRLLEHKRILITGAGGSIGSELSRQVLPFKPAQVLLVERSEFHLFQIHRELKLLWPGVDVEPLMCDVCDEARLEAIFERYQPQVVIHAAAHKHVPLMELNPGEAIKNNVFGTRKIADIADRFEAETFVMISTDKAVNPTSVMGATKRVAELYLQALSQRSSTCYVAVRFGNVLGSAGSVIPIFKEQIAQGGPVTVTHPEMVRYFMTIPEASQLVLQAASMGEGGEIFVLDMGDPVRIMDLATDLIRLSGLEPESDIAIEFSGIRPGEKLFEELGFDAEKMDKTRHPKIFVGKLEPAPWEHITSTIGGLRDASQLDHRETVRDALMAAVPEMQPDATETEGALGPPTSSAVVLRRAGSTV